MKNGIHSLFRRLFAILLTTVIFGSSVLTPIHAWADGTIAEATGGSMTFQKPDGIYSSDGLTSRGTARSGKYTGPDGSSITWSLTVAGALTVSGSGCLRGIWYDNNNNFFGYDIKTVTINSGITSLDDGTFYQCVNLTSVSLPNSVTSIGLGAFYECTAMTAISIPANVSYIGDYAFFNCTSLQRITLPQAVQEIGTEAFAACESLASAVLYGEIGEAAFYGCISLRTVQINGSPETIGDTAFAYCSALTSVNIPSSVASIGLGAFAYCEALTSAHISGNMGESAFDCCYSLENVQIENCAFIGRRCFAECGSLTSIAMPNSVYTIHESAFQECSSLSQVTLPNNLSVLESHLFAYCEALQTITIPSTVHQIEDGVFGMCTSLSSVNIPSGCTSLGESAFYGCKNLTTIALPASVNEIGAGAFYECEKLESIALPNNLKTLGSHAFTFCSALQSLSFASGLEQVGEDAFACCHALSTVSLPDTVQSIGDYAFYDCPALKSIRVPNGVTELPEGVFALCDSLNSVTLPSNLTEIDKAAFLNCEALRSITIPSNVTYLGRAAFAGCKNLQSIALPAGITEILDSTFLDCEKLGNVIISGNVTSIGDYCFAQCEEITSISLPNTIISIGKQAFSFCKKLTMINLPQQLITLGEAAFLGCEKLESLAIGRYVQSIGNDAFAACTSLSSLTLNSNNHYFTIVDSILYTADKTRLISFIPTNNPVSVTIPNTVTSTGELTFYQCKTIKSVTLPSAITEIGDLMFYNCTELQSITIPNTVTRIGAYAFSGCEKLQSANIPDSVQSIGEGAFYNCKSLGSITIPNGISIVNHGAFYGCAALKSLSLPSTITKIDDYAFALCGSLSTVQFPSSLNTIGEYAFAGCDSLRISSIPSGVSSLGEGVFAECSSLTSMALPEGIANISDFLFYDCPSLESVELRGDVFAIGVGSFSDSPALSKVVFAGNAPEVIGSRAFQNTSSDLVLHYDQAATGWGTPQWTGPDQAVYKTSTVYSGTCGANLEWNLVTATGELTIWGTGEMYSWDNISNTPWYPYVDMIKSVTINEGVTSIGASAFRNCSELVTVSIPSTVNKAGYAAFATCFKLNSVECSGGLKAVSECMFYNDDQLWNIEFADGITNIPNYAFYGCCNLGDITVPNSVKKIGEGAFAACVSLKKLTLRGVIDEVNSGAFFDCASLSSIVIETGKPVAVGNYAFYGCNSDLTVIGLADSSWLQTEDNAIIPTVSSSDYSGTIGSISWSIDLFNRKLHISGSGEIPDFDQGGAPWLKYADFVYQLTVDEGITRIGSFAFTEMDCINVISLPSSLQTIGDYGLSKCTSLRSISLPENLNGFGEGAFACCISLIDIDLPSRIFMIPDYAFSECYQLNSISAHTEISTVGYGAFYSCMSLKTVDFFDSLNSIGPWAFAYCQELNTSFSDLAYIGKYAFFCCENLSSVDLTGTIDLGQYAFSQSGLEMITIPGTIKEIPECCFELCKKLHSVSIERGVEIVSKDAFYGCQALTNVNLGKIEVLGDFAFMATGICTITLPNTVTSCGKGVFCNCVNLTAIESNGLFESLEGVLYSGNTLIQFPGGKSVQSLIIPDFVTTIADYAFYGSTSIADVVIGNDVTNIGFAAFAVCSALKTITLGDGISSLPDAMFGDDINLLNVIFLGDAPTSIGDDAFYNTRDSLVLRYAEGNKGWTEGIWVGPDGNSYTTESIVSVSIEKDNNGLLVTVDNYNLTSKEIAIVYSLSANDKTIATKSYIGNFDSCSQQTFLVNVYSCMDSQVMTLEVFVLDANSGAPLTKSSKAIDISSIMANNNIIQVFESDSDNESLLISRSYIQTSVPDVATDCTDTILISRSIPTFDDLPGLVVQAQADYLADHYIPEEEPIILKVVNFINLQPHSEEHSSALYGNYSEGTAAGFIHTYENLANQIINEKGDFVVPSVYYRGRLNAGGFITEATKTLFNRAHIKGEFGHRIEILTTNTTIEAGIDKGIVLDIGTEFNKFKYSRFFRGRDIGEKDSIIEITASYGEGFYLSPPVGLEVSRHKLKISLSTIGFERQGKVEFVLDLDALEKYLGKHFEEFKHIQYIKALKIEVMNSSKEVDREVFVSILRDENNNFKDAWIMPTASAKYLPGEQIYNQALPKSSGGTVMPTDSTQQTGSNQPTGGGGVNTSGKNNNLTQAQKDAIQQATTAAEQAGKSAIPISQQNYAASSQFVDMVTGKDLDPYVPNPYMLSGYVSETVINQNPWIIPGTVPSLVFWGF